MRIAHRSELGYVRARNEDAVLVIPAGPETYVVGVADGMGGHPAGDVASELAVRTLTDRLGGAVEDPDRALVDALRAAHEEITAAASANPAYAGMGTTAAIGVASPDRAWLAHIGDSRIYLVRESTAVQLTHDHNRNGYLTQALGTWGEIEPESLSLSLTPGDRLVLCTDGLSGLVTDETIGAIGGSDDAETACDLLVTAALEAGGYDNVTVVLVEV
jgi:serine/threonine protein phosphatase PrpC